MECFSTSVPLTYLAGQLFIVWGYDVHCEVLSSSPGPYPLDASEPNMYLDVVTCLQGRRGCKITPM